jgi:ATP-binding cassette subfamily E protein 1
VKELFLQKIPTAFTDGLFQQEVIQPFNIDRFINQSLQTLSGGELQRVGIILALGRKSQVYLFDEPSAYLDADQRVIAGKVIKQWIIQQHARCFVIEHDLLMTTYLADKIIVFSGIPGVEGFASSPKPLVEGMNLFLKSLNVTFRRDPTNFRPRINKLNSQKDHEQKLGGNYFVE